MSRRLAVLGIAMTLCFAALLAQLTNIQVASAKRYANDPRNPQVVAARYSQPRGRIVSADNVELAHSVPVTGHSTYKWQRVYDEPWAPLFEQVVGFDSLIYGLTGVEASYNAYLLSHNAPVRTLRDLLVTRTVQDTVYLTLSTTMQLAAQRALAGRAGAVVALDPKTGAVLAMYSNPSFDQNGLASLDARTEQLAWLAGNTPDPNAGGFVPLTSLAYQDIFPPGSTFKIVTTSAAYDHAPQLVDTPMPGYSCIPPGTLRGQTTPLCNYADGYCGGTIAQMLPPSCDTGYALLGARIGAPSMSAEADAFGFNQQPPIDLPPSRFQVSQFLQPSCYQGAEVFLAFSSIGQKCTIASPLQMALVASAIADGGVIMTPHVMAQIRDDQGDLVTTYRPRPWKTATSATTAAAVKGLMQQVAQYGTAAGIFPAGEDVAAKTGTAQVGQGNTATTDWMIAFAPANDPKVAVAVVVPDQPLSATGAQVAGPVMQQVIAAALGG